MSLFNGSCGCYKVVICKLFNFNMFNYYNYYNYLLLKNKCLKGIMLFLTMVYIIVIPFIGTLGK